MDELDREEGLHEEELDQEPEALVSTGPVDRDSLVGWVEV